MVGLPGIQTVWDDWRHHCNVVFTNNIELHIIVNCTSHISSLWQAHETPICSSYCNIGECQNLMHSYEAGPQTTVHFSNVRNARPEHQAVWPVPSIIYAPSNKYQTFQHTTGGHTGRPSLPIYGILLAEVCPSSTGAGACYGRVWLQVLAFASRQLHCI